VKRLSEELPGVVVFWDLLCEATAICAAPVPRAAAALERCSRARRRRSI
jgi:hypothetical protein